MMRTSIQILLLLTCIGSAVSRIPGQKWSYNDSMTTMRKPLLSAVERRFGDRYDVRMYVLDSLVGKGPWGAERFGPGPNADITDPYNQLRGCVLFCASLTDNDPYNDDSSIVGMYKDGSILWTAPILIPGVMEDLFAVSDLNNDGQVDIVAFWSGYLRYDITTSFVWIISWDGTTGKIINDYRADSRASNIMTTANILDLYKPDSSKVFALRAYWAPGNDNFPDDTISTRPAVIYTWNGSSYGLWKSVNQMDADHQVESNLSDRLTLQKLKDATYNDVNFGPVTFKDTDKNGILTINERLGLNVEFEYVGYGDLNSDGKEDAVVIIFSHQGGNTPDETICAVLNDSGRPKVISCIPLDGFADDSIVIAHGLISVKMWLSLEDADCCPSQSEVWQYRLEGEELKRVK
jgi:hypothetical protein